MKRIVVEIPELLGEPSILRQKLPALEQMAGEGEMFKLQPVPPCETPEALAFGLGPDEGQLRQGPLTVAALGADPPERSTHFHLSLLSFVGDVARIPRVQIAAEERDEIMRRAEKLDTKSLTLIPGEGLDHGLVWEDLGDLHTEPPSAVDGQPIRSFLPQGDAESQLRRYIDDSINLLSELELNERRRGEDLPPLNLLWPWGHGRRSPVPNLALRRGEPTLVASGSLRLQGLARLAGYRHADRQLVGQALNPRYGRLVEEIRRERSVIFLFESVANLRALGKLEEAEWFIRQLDQEFLMPLSDMARTRSDHEEPIRISVLAPGATVGLGIRFDTGSRANQPYPFDERSPEERGMRSHTFWDAVAQGLAGT